MAVVLTGSGLTLEDVVRVARHGERVALDSGAAARMLEVRALLERAAARGDPVYGATTGVGVRKRYGVEAGAESFNRRLLLDHRVGQGEPAPADAVRATMLLLANGFASGRAGVRPELAERLVAALNGGERPRVRVLGSACGDVAPLADLAWELFGDTALQTKEGIALLGSGAFSTGLAALALTDAIHLAGALDAAAALDFEAFAANVSVLHPRIGEVRPRPGLVSASVRLRRLLDGSYLWREGAARNLQDPLSFRCLPELHGALREGLEFARRQVELELNASQENPIPVLEEDRFVPTANFELLALAQGLDLARLALAPALTAGCERALKLLQAPLSGLPEGLAARPGLAACGLSEFAFALQALTAEARVLAQPVSHEVVSTTQAEGIEDRLTPTGLAARRLAEMAALGARVVSVELVLAAQAVDLRGARPLGAGTAATYAQTRALVAFVGEDDPIPQDLEPLVRLVAAGELDPPEEEGAIWPAQGSGADETERRGRR